MAPKRILNETSIWNELSLERILPNEKLRSKLWNYLLQRPQTDIHDLLPILHSWNLSKKVIQSIETGYKKFTSRVHVCQESSRGDTIKLLIVLQDGHQVETVIMKHTSHTTVCVSSQIGCQMGCKFCATGTMGIIGDLEAAEIIEQLVHANNITPIRNVVFMGMGEPLNNYENVKQAVEFMINTKRFALSPRQVTVSTVGVLKYMRRLSDELPCVNLALSLHASNQAVRIKIVPTSSAHPILKLMEAVDYHILSNINAFERLKKIHEENVSKKLNLDSCSKEISPGQDHFIDELLPGKKRSSKKTGVMIEYILIKDINDLPEHAHELSSLLSSRKEHILLNLIPYNPTSVAEDYFPPDEERVKMFFDICSSSPYFIHTRVRQEKGQDIAGACGQLALVNKSNSTKNEEKVSKDVEDLGSNTVYDKTNEYSIRTKKSSREESILQRRIFHNISSVVHSIVAKFPISMASTSAQYCMLNGVFIPCCLIFVTYMHSKVINHS